MINHNDIPSIGEIYKEYKFHRNKARKHLAKIKRLKEKYSFLDRIVEPRSSSDKKADDVYLEVSLQKLFESINFKCSKPTREDDVDFRARFKDLYLGVEVKNGNLVRENDTFQPFKHKIMHGDTFHPMVIYNNAKNGDSWGSVRHLIASEVKFGLLLTSELRKGYLKLMSGKITWEKFLEQLGKSGEIKFTDKELKRTI